MLKKLLMLFVAFGLSMSALVASAVEVNTADQTTLETVKGIGPAHAQAIIAERSAHGPFKDADDLASRVKGLGPKSVQNLEAAGLTIGGSSAPPTGKAAASKGGKAAAGTTGTAQSPATAATAATAAAPAPQAASAVKAGKSKHKKDKAAATATATTAGPAAATAGAASDAKAKKGKKAKKGNAASAAAASGA